MDDQSREHQPRADLDTAGEWLVRASVGQILSRAWELYKPDAFKYALLTLVVYLIGVIPVVGGLFVFLFPFEHGMMIYALRRAEGVKPRLRDLERVFDLFGTLLLMRLAYGVLCFIGFLLLFIPGIYLMVAYVLAFPLVLDRGVSFWTALETSRRVVTTRWFTVFGAVLIAGMILSASYFARVVGFLFAWPFYLCVVVAMYEAAVGVQGGSPTRPREQPASEAAV